MLREIAILGRLEHPNVVRLVDVSRPPPAPPAGIDTLYVVFEYGGMDLHKLVCVCVCVCVCAFVCERERAPFSKRAHIRKCTWICTLHTLVASDARTSAGRRTRDKINHAATLATQSVSTRRHAPTLARTHGQRTRTHTPARAPAGKGTPQSVDGRDQVRHGPAVPGVCVCVCARACASYLPRIDSPHAFPKVGPSC